MGTGYAWAWQVIAKFVDWVLLICNVRASVENEGAREPTGSNLLQFKKLKKKNL